MELKREELVKIIDAFYCSTDKDMMNLFMETLNKLEEVLIKYEYNEDSRFVTFGRRDFLKQELTASLEEKNYEQAFYDIVDYVKADTWISSATVPSEYNFQEVIKIDTEYKDCGIICLQEKEILLAMIKEFKKGVLENE